MSVGSRLSAGIAAGGDSLSDSRAAPPDWADWQGERLAGLETGLSDRSPSERQWLLQALGAAIREAIATGRPAGAVLIDLEKFSGINAAWGPSVGDDVLAEVRSRIVGFAAGRLSDGRARAAARAGRLDADHFLIIAAEVESEDGLREAIVELVKQLAQPIMIDAHSIAIGARAAIVQIPAHGRSLTTVLGRCFSLLNTAARTRADAVAQADRELQSGSSAVMLERDLADALATDQLFLALQPKMAIPGRQVRGAEALVRWRHPDRGLLMPSTFIETAERSGLIFDFGLRVLRDACRAANSLFGTGSNLSIAVNVSAHQLAHPNFLSRFLEVIDHEGVAPQTIEIEVTETAAMMGGVPVLESLRALRRCGIRIAVDDFGTGFSNLAALAALPADTLKIDRSLVVGIGKGETAEALLGLAVELGRKLSLETVAEGVETETQFDHLAGLGCDLAQGFFTGRPVPVGEFAARYLV